MSTSEPEPAGEFHVEREQDNVIVRIEEDEGEETYYLPPTFAFQIAMWLQQAAMDAKQWRQEENHE